MGWPTDHTSMRFRALYAVLCVLATTCCNCQSGDMQTPTTPDVDSTTRITSATSPDVTNSTTALTSPDVTTSHTSPTSPNITNSTTALTSPDVTNSTTAPTTSGAISGTSATTALDIANITTATPTAVTTTPITATPTPEFTTPITATPSYEVTIPITATPTPEFTTPITATPSYEVTTPITATPTLEVTTPITATPTLEVTTPITATPTPDVTSPTISTTPNVTSDATTEPLTSESATIDTTPSETTTEPSTVETSRSTTIPTSEFTTAPETTTIPTTIPETTFPEIPSTLMTTATTESTTLPTTTPATAPISTTPETTTLPTTTPATAPISTTPETTTLPTTTPATAPISTTPETTTLPTTTPATAPILTTPETTTLPTTTPATAPISTTPETTTLPTTTPATAPISTTPETTTLPTTTPATAPILTTPETTTLPTTTPATAPILTTPETTTLPTTTPATAPILTTPEPTTTITTTPETTAAAGVATTTPWRPTTIDSKTTEATEMTTFGETTMIPSTVTYPEQTCPPDNSIRNVTLWSVCTSRYFRFNATENSTESQLVGRIEGSTPSGVQVLTSNFTISDDNDASLFFMLTNCSNSYCDIVTSQHLDRESKATFFFEVLWLREVYFIDTHVTVQDCSSIPVEININDLNDNPPSFNPGVIAPYVLDQSPAGSIVAVLSASDADTGPNAAVRYSITPRTYADYFAVDSDGVVTARLPVGQDELRQSGLLADGATELLFEVVASDGRFDTNINVSFDVLTVQTGGPAINRSLPIEVTALEEQPPGTHVVNLRTERPSDSDSMVYSFGNTVSSFSLDSTTGEITTAEPLDRETKDSHYIVVSASDPESGIFSSVVAEITVAVEDINDKSPVLSQTEYQGRIPEHADEGQLVILNDIGIVATDADIGENGRITFELRCCHDLFQIDPETAEIRTADNSSFLDRETVSAYDLIVIARDNPTNTTLHRESSATVTIDLMDINDNRPIFQNGSQLNISIAEDIGRGFSVATITAADADSGSNGRIFYTINSGGDGKFTISPTSGVLSLASELDREVKSMYRISISASDGGSPSLTSEDAFLVHVTVLDVNDNEPEFLQNIYYVTIDEESDIVTNVANITALDADEGSNAEVRYTMFNCAPQFSIDYTTGSMYVQSRLDYENTTFSRSYSCSINATDGNYTSTALVQVEVRDINDNTPEFGTEDGYSTQLLFNENQVFPAIVAAVDATDKDSGSNGDISFSIYNSSCSENVTANFTIDESTGIIRLHGIIVLGQPFPSWCNMTVVATDRGVPSLSSSTTVSVGISKPTDVTSKVTFDDTAFSGFVVENDDTVQHIVKVNAVAVGTHDCEAILRYEFASWQTEDFEFTIDSTTGNVSSRSVSFDRELKATYAFAVIAANNCSGESKRFDYTSVIVHVNDMNDEQPTFSRPEYRMQVEEGMSGLVVGRVTAEDRDEGSNGVITYTINGEGGEYFDIDGNGAMMTKVALDRENITQYQISVMAEDRGQPAQNSTSVVIIDVLDVNDNAPRFDESLYAVTLPEDLARFSPLNVTVKATDKDHGLNGTVTYSLSGEGWQTFKIEALSPEYTGTITLQQQLDYENTTSYNLAVIAKDGGQPPLNSSIPLFINVTDVNDNEPIFERLNYNASVPRNVRTDVVVVNVSATDRDTGKNGAVWYNITEIEANLFQIDNATGAIYVTADFIKDTTSHQYALLVMALDMGIPSLNSITKVSVDVSSTNLYPPEFRDVPPSHQMFEDDGRRPWQSKRVIEVRASDNDTDSEGEVQFSLAEGISEDLFRLSASPTIGDQDFFGAEIWTKSQLDREKHPEGIILQVLAIDQGVTPKTSTATVHITLKDLNDNPPELHLPEDDVIISQSSDVGTLVLQVNVTDPDQEGQLHYQIQDNSDDTLVMDSTTGDIYLQKKINESLQDITNFVIVEVQDWDPEIEDQRGTEKNVGGLTIIFRYDNPNEHPPMFEPNDYKTVLDDFLPVGSNLTNLNISACDMDCPESCETVGPVTNCSKEGTIVYSIKENVRDIFSINEMTGVITTTWPFDKATENYTLIIAATDQADIPRSGTATVRVFVTESLENPTDGPSQPSPGMCTDGITDTQLQAENEQLTYILYGVGAVAGLLALITGGVTTKLIFSLRRIKNMSTAHLTTPAFRDPGAYEYLSAKTDYAYAEGKGDDDDDSQPPALPPTHTRPSLDSRRPSNVPRLSRAGIGYYTPPMEMTSFAGSSRGTREQLRNDDGDDLSIRDGGYLTMEASMPDYANQHHDPYLRAQDDTSREIRYGYLPLNTSEREQQRPHSEYYNGHDRTGDTRYGYQSRQSRTPVEDSSEHHRPGDTRYGYQSRQSKTPVEDSSEHNRPGDTRYGYQSRQSRTMEDSSEHNRPDYVRSRHQSHQPMEPEMSNSQQQDRNNQHASPDRSDKRRYSHQDSSGPQGDHSTPWQYVSPHALQTRNNSQTRHHLHGGQRDDGHSRKFSYTKNVQPSPSPGKGKAPGRPHHKARRSGRKKSGNSTDPLLSPHSDDLSGNKLEEGEVDLWGQFS
ncbi:cadherin-87A-like isoform X2 [Branchiostoma floridae x Branchiostoma japonicum]